MQKLFLLLVLVVALALAFDKNTVRKGKRDPTEKHPISRRVLRFERSAAVANDDDMMNEFDLPYPVMDFAKALPDLPAKLKNTNSLPPEYSEIDF